MLKLRFGKYELERIDQYNVGVFRVCPDGAKERRGGVRNRTAEDGATLVHLGKYYGSYGAAARGLWEILLAERIEDPGIATVADAIEAAKAEMLAVTERLEAAARKLEAAS